MRAIGAALGLAALLVLSGPLVQGQATTTLTVHCDQPAAGLPMMEQTYIVSGCWGHVGMHTYFVGVDTVYALHGGQGTAFVVEQQLSPPIEGLGASVGPPVRVDSAVLVEVSLDGRDWTEVGRGTYRFAQLLPTALPTRQNVAFDFDADGVEFRFLRVREPLSAAQGLSGYIDFSTLTLDVEAVEPAAPPALTPQEGQLRTCALDILEDVYPGHPCFFGGVDRWDAPSFFHTYFLGDSRLDRVQGLAVLNYFRPDDPGTCCGQTLPGVLDGPLLVQTSVDGRAWDTLASVDSVYGAPTTFDLGGLGGKPAAFVRLVSEKHPGYNNHPALKHPEAYLLLSELQLSGQLP